jgi:nicotinate-nucleotide pyrophosphorylase (carboxylating)
VTIEVSGGISEETIGAYALDGVDVISVGKITHGPPPCDISMKIATLPSKI